MSTITVSRVDNAIATECRDENIAAILQGIKQGKWSDKIEIVRRDFANGVKEKGTIAGGKAAAAASKKRLPAVTFSGRFKERKDAGIDTHSGLLCIDLDGDGLNGDPDSVRETLSKDQHVLACWESPTGSGCLFGFPPTHQSTSKASRTRRLT
jgi:VirE N-terminal domain